MAIPSERAVRPRARRRTALVVAGIVAVLAIGLFAVRSIMTSAPPPVADPAAAELDAFSATTVFFAHQSVGANTLEGLATLLPDAAQLVETTAASDVRPGTVAHAFVGVNGAPQTKIDEFVRIMDAGMADAVEVALLKLCYTDVTAGSDPRAVFAAYAEAIEDVGRRHPGVVVLAATVPVTQERDLRGVVKSWLGRDDGLGAEHNRARAEFNALVRAAYGDTGRLFDIAAVESGGGTSLHGGLAADPGHLNALGARAAAGELVRTVAANARR